MRLPSSSRARYGQLTTMMAEKTDSAAQNATIACGLFVRAFSTVRPQKSKLIILRITRMPRSIQNPHTASTMFPVSVWNSSRM